MYSIKVLNAAQQDYEESILWYKERSMTVANNFATKVEMSLRIIANSPNTYNKGYKASFHYYMIGFPFTIIYTVDETERMVLVRAIYHQKRNPRNKYR